MVSEEITFVFGVSLPRLRTLQRVHPHDIAKILLKVALNTIKQRMKRLHTP
jgi:hypothetical protein